jgi:hypothetical protein
MGGRRFSGNYSDFRSLWYRGCTKEENKAEKEREQNNPTGNNDE